MNDKRWNSAPEMAIDTDKTYNAKITTDKGVIELELATKAAPVTVNNFVFLARENFYDGVIFHRVIPNFMIQGGDPTGTGRGDAGYKFDDELNAESLRHETHVISMANAGPNTNGSQFFITHAPQPHLNGMHTVFGKVISGGDVVDTISGGDVMNKVEIEEL